MRAITILLVLTGVALLAVPLQADDASKLVGTWQARTAEGGLSVTFTKDGRITIVETGASGTETSRGRYELGPGVIVVRLVGVEEPLRYPYKLDATGGLTVRDQDGTAIGLRKQAATPTPPQTPARPAPAPTAAPKVYSQWICYDQGGIQHPATGRPLEAFRMWIPQGWRVQGGVHWKLNYKSVLATTRSDLVNPAQIRFTVSSPGGEAAVSVYPDEPFTDLSGAPAAPMFPKGSQYGGTTVWPPLDPRQYVEQALLPRYFQGIQNARVVGYTPVPALATFYLDEIRQFNAVAGRAGAGHMSLAAGATTVDFQMNGRTWREQFVVALLYIKMPGMVMWWPRMAWSVRALREQFQAMLPSLLTSIYSFKLNGLWFLLYKRIVDQNWRGIAAVDATIRKIDAGIVASRAKTASLIHRQLYPVLTGMATKSAPGYAPLPLDSMKNHAVDPQGNLRELPDGQDMGDLPPGWKPMTPVPVK